MSPAKARRRPTLSAASLVGDRSALPAPCAALLFAVQQAGTLDLHGFCAAAQKICVPSCPGSPLCRARQAAAAACRVPSLLQGPGAAPGQRPGGVILCPGASVRLSRPFVVRYGFPFPSPVSPPPREGRGAGPAAGLRPPTALAVGPPGCTLMPGGLPASLHCTGESRPRQAHRFSGAALTFPGALEVPQGRIENSS